MTLTSDESGAAQATGLLEQADALARAGSSLAALARYRMGRVLDRMGRPEDAREMYHRARELGAR